MKIKYERWFNVSIHKMKEVKELIELFFDDIPEDEEDIPIIGSGLLIFGIRRKDTFIVKEVIQTRFDEES